MLIDIDILIKERISVSVYVLACFIYDDNQEGFLKYSKECGKFHETDIKKLIDEGYLIYSGDDKTYNFYELYVTKKLEELVGQMNKGEVVPVRSAAAKKPDTQAKPELDNFHNFCTRFREIFPKGVKPAGKPVKSPIKDIEMQLKKFEKTYPEYTRDEIITAAAHYVHRYKMKGYQYMRTAHYFISKQGDGSDLAAEIEEIKEHGLPKEMKMYGTEVK